MGSVLFCAVLLALLTVQQRTGISVRASTQAVAAKSPLRTPDVACARCHAAIYASYERTAMGRGSGTAMNGLIPGSFHHDPSDVTYRIFERDGRAWMNYRRGASGAPGALAGEEELLYFVGSGKRGRTFLYRKEGQWFELPVNYYRRRDRWDMAPAYDATTSMPAPLPVDANCIHCHATSVETPLPQAHSRFPERPFDQGGVGCSSCHGDPAQHLAANGHGPILNPNKMTVAARDSACIQCHLEGNAVVYKPGRSLAQFRPGDTLSDFAVYFVRASEAGGGQRASSQYEALLQSACKRASGDRLTCTTCHDPHSEPAPAERVAFFRASCLRCHNTPEMATAHHPEQPDCAVCHMPTRATADISHEQVTDHNIQRRPLEDAPPVSTTGLALVPVGGLAVSDRELGLAYAQLAGKGDRDAGQRALRLLKSAERAGADDEQLHANLGLLEQVNGDAGAARVEYAAAIRQDPFSASALTNRAVLDAATGNLPEAVRLLDRLVTADPSQTSAGLNLAFLECRVGEVAQSRALAKKLQDFNPDDAALKAFLATGRLGDAACKAIVPATHE